MNLPKIAERIGNLILAGAAVIALLIIVNVVVK